MKAVVIKTLGPPSVMEIVKNFPKPAVVAGEVLVSVRCTSVNPIDYKIRGGKAGPAMAMPLAEGMVLGGDVSGVVAETNEGGKFKEGDRVMGCYHLPFGKYGSYAELVPMREDGLVKIPEGLTFEQAAALPLVSLTAWQALEKAMPLQGKHVLVHAGAGGVGSIAIQIAKAHGAHVTTTCSATNVEFVTKELGADLAVDYNKDRFEDVVKEKGIVFDAVVDLVGGDYELRSLPLTKPGVAGYYANVLNSGWFDKHPSSQLCALSSLAYNVLRGKARAAWGSGPRYDLILMGHQAGRGLEQVLQLWQEGKVKPLIARVLPLEAVVEAHEYLERRHARGKVVLTVSA